MRDITAAEWGDTRADTATTAFIKAINLPFSLNDIDTCSKCGDPACSGRRELCGLDQSSKIRGKVIAGCEQIYYGCERSHYTILMCDNPECLHVNEVYRQCVGHTCIFL